MGKRKYTAELKMEIVHAALNSKNSVESLSKAYGIEESNIRKWIGGYKQSGVEGVERSRLKFNPEFRLQVITDLRENHLAYRAAAVKYNIGAPSTIRKWERIYLEEGYEGLKKNNAGRASVATGSDKGRKPIFKKELHEDLIAENQRLKMENEYLKKLNALIRAKEI